MRGLGWLSMMATVWIACGSTDEPEPPPDPTVVQCQEGQVETVLPAGQDHEVRWVEATEVHVCTDAEGRAQGRQVERYEQGSIAAIGFWEAGERQGTWTRWTPEGAFAERRDYLAGQEHGKVQVIADDHRVLQLTVREGRMVSMKALAAGMAMPEWREGDPVPVEGRGYAGAAEAPEAKIVEPSE